jgi:hypothetical protein
LTELERLLGIWLQILKSCVRVLIFTSERCLVAAQRRVEAESEGRLGLDVHATLDEGALVGEALEGGGVGDCGQVKAVVRGKHGRHVWHSVQYRCLVVERLQLLEARLNHQRATLRAAVSAEGGTSGKYEALVCFRLVARHHLVGLFKAWRLRARETVGTFCRNNYLG